MKHILLSALLLTGSFAGSLGLNVNDEDVELQAEIDLSRAINNGMTYIVSADYLHTDEDNLFKVGFGATNNFQSADGLTLTLGLEGVFADNFGAVPLFAQASLRLPFDQDIPATYINTRVDYAPSVLCFSDGDGYLEYRLEADMEVINKVHLYTGYRNIETDYDKGDHKFNNSWYGGMKIGF